MRAITVLSLIFLSLIVSPVFSASSSSDSSDSASTGKPSAKAISHSHNGRIHSHILPTSGIKHFHKHSHNGRSHIHPYSAEIGFKHTHNSPQKKLAVNSVKHQHGSSWHSHPLPLSGLKHPHRHKHGGRTHTHLLPADGVKHYHRLNPQKNLAKNKSSTSNNNNLTKQIDLAMKSTKQPPTQATTPFNQNDDDYSLSSAQTAKNQQKVNIKEIVRQLSLANKISTNRTKPVIKKSRKKKVSRAKSVARKEPKLTRKVKSSPKPIPLPVPKKVIVETPTEEQQLSSTRQFEIGLRYDNGTGVEKNLKQAAKWYRRAAEQGNPKAQFNLASLYENGQGVEKNLELAMKWYKKAAEQGNVQDQDN